MKSRFCFTLLLLALAVPPALAQQTTATLLGTVSDSSGAVVPGVTIRVTNLANQVSRETKSDDSGLTLPFLPSGEYSVSATADGFKVQKVDRVILGVQQTGRVDLKLELGEVTQTIDVEGGGLFANGNVYRRNGHRLDEDRGTAFERAKLRSVGSADSWSPSWNARQRYGAPRTRLDWADGLTIWIHSNVCERFTRHSQSLFHGWHRNDGLRCHDLQFFSLDRLAGRIQS